MHNRFPEPLIGFQWRLEAGSIKRAQFSADLLQRLGEMDAAPGRQHPQPCGRLKLLHGMRVWICDEARAKTGSVRQAVGEPAGCVRLPLETAQWNDRGVGESRQLRQPALFAIEVNICIAGGAQVAIAVSIDRNDLESAAFGIFGGSSRGAADQDDRWISLRCSIAVQGGCIV